MQRCDHCLNGGLNELTGFVYEINSLELIDIQLIPFFNQLILPGRTWYLQLLNLGFQ
jgi:hypothetical protein